MGKFPLISKLLVLIAISASGFARLATAQGFMLDTNPIHGLVMPNQSSNNDVMIAKAWGAKYVRVPLYSGIPPWEFSGSNGVAGSLSEADLYRLWLIFYEAAIRGMYVVIDMHNPPGSVWGTGTHDLFTNQVSRAAFLHSWRRIFRLVRGQQYIYGFDVLNEPKTSDYSALRTLLTEVAQIKQSEGNSAPLIIESAHGSTDTMRSLLRLDTTSGRSFVRGLGSNVILSAHIYPRQSWTGGGRAYLE